METISSYLCPRCGRMQLNIYFSSNTEEKLGIWCENCNLKGYFEKGELVCMKYISQFESM
jgi:DNA-directed RNA polymerase subunit RPC12/RpoP